ncbi:hypothetical protein AB6A40_006171 [Gnathostoma spinigerum]|uniref:Phosphomevalonate kinase n=1 Tax=Gnathostoma spinigerum TaxID=75299 RepID=A0ABD6ESD0_9BILA
MLVNRCVPLYYASRVKENLEQYAIEHGLDVEQLKSNGPYKEIYREAMVKWGEEMRAKDPTYFCRVFKWSRKDDKHPATRRSKCGFKFA